MRVTLRIPIDAAQLAYVLQHYDEIKIYRSVDGRDGEYVELTTASTRIRMSSEQTLYMFADNDGDPSYYYTTSYHHRASARETEQSEPMLGDGDSALSLLSVREVEERYLHGIDLHDMTESAKEFHIKAAMSHLEHELDITIRRVEVIEEAQDFVRPEQGFIQLNKFPLISVERVQMRLPDQTEEDAPFIDYPMTSIKPDKDAAHIRIVPPTRAILASPWSVWMGLMGVADSVPDVWRIDYTAGFERGAVPEVLLDVVGKLAALEMLGIAGDLVLGAGIAGEKTRVDELWTEIETTKDKDASAYEARIKRYITDVTRKIPMLRRQYKGIRMVLG